MFNNGVYEFAMPNSEIEVIGMRPYKDCKKHTFELKITLPFQFKQLIENYNCKLVILGNTTYEPSKTSLQNIAGKEFTSSNKTYTTTIHGKLSNKKLPSIKNSLIEEKNNARKAICEDILPGFSPSKNTKIFWHELDLKDADIPHIQANISMSGILGMPIAIALVNKDHKGVTNYIPLSYHHIQYDYGLDTLNYHSQFEEYIHKKSNPLCYPNLKPIGLEVNCLSATGIEKLIDEIYINPVLKLYIFDAHGIINTPKQNPLNELEGKFYYCYQPYSEKDDKNMIINVVPPKYLKDEGMLNGSKLFANTFSTQDIDGKGEAYYTLGAGTEDTKCSIIELSYKPKSNNPYDLRDIRRFTTSYPGHQNSTLQLLSSHNTKDKAYENILKRQEINGIHAKAPETEISSYGYKVLYNHKKATYDVIEYERIHNLEARPEFASDMNNFLPESGHEFFKIGNTFYLRFTSDKPVKLKEIFDRAIDFMQPWKQNVWRRSKDVFFWQKTAGIYSEEHTNFGQFVLQKKDQKDIKIDKARCLIISQKQHASNMVLTPHNGKEYFQFSSTLDFFIQLETDHIGRPEYLCPIPFSNHFIKGNAMKGFNLVTIGRKHSHSINY